MEFSYDFEPSSSAKADDPVSPSVLFIRVTEFHPAARWILTPNFGEAMGNLVRAFFAIAVLFAASVGAAAQTYPSRPVTIVLPYTAGGAVEAVARLLGERLARGSAGRS